MDVDTVTKKLLSEEKDKLERVLIKRNKHVVFEEEQILKFGVHKEKQVMKTPFSVVKGNHIHGVVEKDEETLPSVVEKSTLFEIDQLSNYCEKESFISGGKPPVSGVVDTGQWSCNKRMDSESNLEHKVGSRQFPGMSEVLEKPVVKKETKDIKKCNICLKEFRYAMQLEKHMTDNDCWGFLSQSEDTGFKKKPKYYLVDMLKKRSISRKISESQVSKIENDDCHNINNNFDSKHLMKTQKENTGFKKKSNYYHVDLPRKRSVLKKKYDSQASKIKNDYYNFDNNIKSIHSMETPSGYILSNQNDIGLQVNIVEDSVCSFSPDLCVNLDDTSPCEDIQNIQNNLNDTGTEVKVETQMIKNFNAEIPESNMEKSDTEIKEESKTTAEFNMEKSGLASDDNSGIYVKLTLNSSTGVKVTTERDVIKEIYKETELNSENENMVSYSVPEEDMALSEKGSLFSKTQNQIKENGSTEFVRRSPVKKNELKPFDLNYKSQKKERAKKGGNKKSKADMLYCRNCGFEYSTIYEFLKHYDICQIISKTEMPERMVYNCKICHAGFKFKNNLLRHLQIHMDTDSYE